MLKLKYLIISRRNIEIEIVGNFRSASSRIWPRTWWILWNMWRRCMDQNSPGRRWRILRRRLRGRGRSLSLPRRVCASRTGWSHGNATGARRFRWFPAKSVATCRCPWNNCRWSCRRSMRWPWKVDRFWRNNRTGSTRFVQSEYGFYFLNH